MVRLTWAPKPIGVMASSRLAGPPGQPQRGLAGGEVDHAEIAPEHALAEAGAERLAGRLLRRVALGIGGGAQLLGAAVGLAAFQRREDALQEALAMPLQHPLDAANVHDVVAEADDHVRAGSIQRGRQALLRSTWMMPGQARNAAMTLERWRRSVTSRSTSTSA